MIKKDHLVEKRNILNELRCNNMRLQELRFFTIYLSKINPRYPAETRRVEFKLSEFLAIMEIRKVNIAVLKQITNSLLCKVVNIPDETGGYIGFQLFKECHVRKGSGGEWFIEIDANDRALPLMFEFKEKYFTYELWNALRLGSVNQLRMYEILKQYEWKGQRIISVKELKKLLFIDDSEYPRFDNFKTWVLNSCKKALKENTDICYEYELIRRGRGGKVEEIKFIITKNMDYTGQLSLDDFINHQKTADVVTIGGVGAATMDGAAADGVDDEENYFARELYPFLRDVFKDEFALDETRILYNLATKVVPYKIGGDGAESFTPNIYDYLKRKYGELKRRARRKDLPQVKSRFVYLKKIIEADLAALSGEE